MKHLLCLVLFAGALAAQTVTITDTIKTPMGGNWGGTVQVTLNNPQTAQPLYSGSVTLSGWSQTVTVTDGAFTITLYANDTITPTGTSYTARYTPASGSAYSETWVVPAGATTIRELRATTRPTPSVMFTPSQITQASATLGQGLRWNGSTWAPGTFVADPMTATGDLITRSGGVAVRLGIGSTGQVLTVAGGLPTWATDFAGNAATATALAADGANCSAGSVPLGVDASGAAQNCTALPTTITGTANQITVSAATGPVTISLPANVSGLTSVAATTFTGALTGNASTATALAANPTDCSAGQFANAIAASGNLTCAAVSLADVSGAIGGASAVATGQVLYGTAAGVAGSEAAFTWGNAGNVKALTLTDGSSQGSTGNLFVNWAGGQPKFRIGATNNVLPSMQFFTTAGAESFYILNAGPWRVWDSGSNGIAFGTNNTERARFAATTGNLLLGTTIDGNFRLDIGASGSAGTIRAYDQTPTTGVTQLIVRAGAGQGSTNLTTWQNAAGTVMSSVGSSGNFLVGPGAYFETASGAVGINQGLVNLGSGAALAWGNTASYASTKNVAIARNADGILEINNGTAGTFRDLRLRSLISSTATPSSASDTGVTGQWAWDTNYIYIATGTNTWKRVAIATW